MKTIFTDYRTPTMSECEILGREISLPRRVVQVWFQNARAKEKKIVSPDATSQSVGGGVGPPLSASLPDSCELCGIRYSSQLTVQDHLFTRLHIDRVKVAVCSQREVTGADDRHRASDSSLHRARRYSSSKPDDLHATRPRPAVSAAGILLTPPIAAVPSSNALTQSALVSGVNKLDSTSAGASKTAHLGSVATSTTMPVSNSFTGSAAQILAPYAAAAAAASFPNDVLGMMPYFYPGLAATGYYPGAAGIPFIQPPALLPGQENMFMFDPANFGTPLTLLQIPPRSIQRVQDKLTDPDCAVTYYSQDCRHFSDLRKSVGADDWAVARRSTVDVGYICRRCHIVYPGRTACAGHQDAQCYRDAAAPYNAIVKLEQVQYECAACRVKASTIAEYKTHCAGDSHRKAAAAWVRVHATASQPAVSAAPPRSSDADIPTTTSPTAAPVVLNRSTPASANQETKPDVTGEGPPSNSS